MASGDFKDLTRRTASDKILHNETFDIAKNSKYDWYQRGLASIVYKFFDKTIPGGGIKNEIISNRKLAEELHKPIIRKYKKRKVHSLFIDNVSAADLADMQLISKFNEGIRFLLCVTRGVATNNGLGGQVQIGTFLYRKYKRGIKESNVSSSC